MYNKLNIHKQMENATILRLSSLKNNPTKNNNNWNNKKRILKAKFTSLTDADLRFKMVIKMLCYPKFRLGLG